MKRATKKQIYKACELLETKRNTFSCPALLGACGKGTNPEIDYESFFNPPKMGGGDTWRWDTHHYMPNNTDSHNRIMALLLYLEARDDV